MSAEVASTSPGPLVDLAGDWALWPVAAVRSAGVPFDALDRYAVPDLLGTPPGDERNAAIRRRCGEAVRATVLDDVVREALVWQNPDLVDTWLAGYAGRAAAEGAARLSNRAYREGVVARYAQRYGAKNESIGFFGPVGWARLVPDGAGLCQSGGGGIRRRTVYLETWAVAALADAWRHEEEILPHLPVRLDAATSVENGRLRRPRRPPSPCDATTSALLRAVDGRRSVGEVLAVAADGQPQATLRAELARLHDEGVVRIGFRVPHHERPERCLREQVDQVRDERVRADLLQRLDDVVGARDAVQRSRGPEPVRAALADLARQFAKAGGAPITTRRTGYARTPAYLDCRRDTDVRVGGDLLDDLRDPLAILLDSARWLSAEIVTSVDERMLQRYRHLARTRGEVTLSDLQFAVGDLLSPTGPAAREVLADFQLRWAEILATTPGGTAHLTSHTVRPLVDVLFRTDADTPAWAAARQHSPDLLLRRRADGTHQWVLGELHVALNTLESRVFRTQSDDPDELVALTRRDLSGGRVVPLYPLEAVEATARTYPPPALDPPGHYRYWSPGSDHGHPDGAPAVPGTAVLVRERGDELVGEPRGLGWRAPVLEFFGEFLTATVVNLFRLRAPARHRERVLLDDVVICRESWSVPLREAPVPPPGRRIADRGHQALREWAAGLGMPRHVFVRTPGERKPWYVDFCSPLLVGNLVRALRRPDRGPAADGPAAEEPPTLDVVEMLPGPDELWLTDAGGHAYTSEFRVVAVARTPGRPAVQQVRNVPVDGHAGSAGR